MNPSSEEGKDGINVLMRVSAAKEIQRSCFDLGCGNPKTHCTEQRVVLHLTAAIGDRTDSPWANSSEDLLLFDVHSYGERFTLIKWPCNIRVVEQRRGRTKEQNSLALIARERGQLCFWASIESRIPLTRCTKGAFA